MALTAKQKQELSMKKQQIHQNLKLKLILEELEANENAKIDESKNLSSLISIKNAK